jgi:hypothetical protein
MPNRTLVLPLVFCASVLASCAQRLTTQDDKGFIYYEPQPYLVVAKNMSFGASAAAAKPPTPEEKPEKKEGATGKAEKGGIKSYADIFGSAAPQEAKDEYEYRIIYLPRACPDAACEEAHRIRVTNGIGSMKASVTLEHGWMLTGLSTENDAQVDEMVAATAQVISAVGSLGVFATQGKLTVPPTTAVTEREAFIRLYDVETWSCVFSYPARSDCPAKPLVADPPTGGTRPSPQEAP